MIVTSRSGAGSGAKKSGRGGSKKSGSGALSLGEELELAAEGLRHMSESDYPFQFFTLPTQDEKELTPQGFLDRLGISGSLLSTLGVPPERLIREKSFEGFFPSADDLAERSGADPDDPEVVEKSERYRALEAVLNARLRDLTVFRVGEVEVRCYIAGRDERGNVAGLMTTSVET